MICVYAIQHPEYCQGDCAKGQPALRMPRRSPVITLTPYAVSLRWTHRMTCGRAESGLGEAVLTTCPLVLNQLQLTYSVPSGKPSLAPDRLLDQGRNVAESGCTSSRDARVRCQEWKALCATTAGPED
jgi:hypothetical protein